MYDKANFIKNTECRKCRDKGHDKHGDNFAVYSDGGGYCWKCGHSVMGSNTIGKFLHKRDLYVPKTLPLILLPSDAGSSFPDRVMKWLEQYHLDRRDMIQNGILYSEQGIGINRKGKREQASGVLLFPFWQGEILLGYQARYFGTNVAIPKWISKGDVQTIVHILYNGKLYKHEAAYITKSYNTPGGEIIPPKKERVGHACIKASRLILTEDIVSAIKVSKAGEFAMPIFGTNVKSRWPQIRVISPLETILWLDGDMGIKMKLESHSARLNGFKCHMLWSDKDPKWYTVEKLKEMLK